MTTGQRADRDEHGTPPRAVRSRVILLHGGGSIPSWAARSAQVVPLLAPHDSATELELSETLRVAECVLLDATDPDPLAAARLVHGLNPEVQVVLVTPTEARRRELQRAVTFTPGIGELWIASPEEFAGGVADRAAGVTRQRRKFQRTRERIERERVEASPQRSARALISDEYLANLLHVLPDPVFSADASGRVLSANPAATRVLRRRATGLTGATLDEALGTADVVSMFSGAGDRTSRSVTFVRADDSEGHGDLLVARVGTSSPPLFAVMLHDLTEQHEALRKLEEQTHELARANGQLQDQAVELEAQAEELHATVNELQLRTEEAERAQAALIESEQQFRTLADTIPTLAWTARADGYLDWYNARWYEYTGTTPAELEGWGWQRVHHPDVLPEVVERWRRSIDTGEPFEMTFPLRAADGSFRRFLTRVTPVRSPDGTVLRWFGTNTDVEVEHAARAAAEQARAEAERQREVAEEANRAKSEFLSTMSHELRTPLNAIQGYADLLAMGVRGPVSDAQLQDLDRIRRANRYLMSLITDVLNFARLEAGKVELSPTSVELVPLLDDVETLVMPQLTAKGLRLHRECVPEDAEAPTHVCADSEKLSQVLLNLLTNSIKFTEPGGRVTLACGSDAGGSVRILVSDTGRGIPAEQLASIFEPFVQVDRHQTHESQQGVGLGLAISRDLVRAMNGEITVQSTVGAGSTFTITLPRG